MPVCLLNQVADHVIVIDHPCAVDRGGLVTWVQDRSVDDAGIGDLSGDGSGRILLLVERGAIHGAVGGQALPSGARGRDAPLAFAELPCGLAACQLRCHRVGPRRLQLFQTHEDDGRPL